MSKITVRIYRARSLVAALALGHGTTMVWTCTACSSPRRRTLSAGAGRGATRAA